METKTYYDKDDVMLILGVKQDAAYKIIRTLNAELKEKGYITVAGRVSKKYFDERYYG